MLGMETRTLYNIPNLVQDDALLGADETHAVLEVEIRFAIILESRIRCLQYACIGKFFI
jgi:hypothetical protein